MGYISLSKSMSLRDELVENERAASDKWFASFFAYMARHPVAA